MENDSPDDLDSLSDSSDDLGTSLKFDQTVDDGEPLTTDDSEDDYSPIKYNRLHPLGERIYKLLNKVQPVSDSIWRPVRCKRISVDGVTLHSDSLQSSGMKSDHQATSLMLKSSTKRKREDSSDDSQSSYKVRKKKRNSQEKVHHVSGDEDKLKKQRSKNEEKKYPHLLSSENEDSPKKKKRSSDIYSIQEQQHSLQTEHEREKCLQGDNEKSSKKKSKSSDFNLTKNFHDASDNEHTPKKRHSSQKELMLRKEYPHLLSSESEGSPKSNKIFSEMNLTHNTQSSSADKTSKKRHLFQNEVSAVEVHTSSESKSPSDKRNSHVHSSKVNRKAISHNVSDSDSDDSGPSSVNKPQKIGRDNSVISQSDKFARPSSSRPTHNKAVSNATSSSDSDDFEKSSTSKHQETGRSESSSVNKRPLTSKHKETLLNRDSSSDRYEFENASTSKNKETRRIDLSSSNKHQTHINGNVTVSDPPDEVEMDQSAQNLAGELSSESDLDTVHTAKNKTPNSSAGSDSKSAQSNQLQNQSQEKSYVEHVFTEEDENEISKLSVLLDDNLLEENNIWLLQCPSEMDCSRLVGQYLSLDGNSELEARGVHYETFSLRSEKPRNVSLAVPSKRNRMKIRSLPIVGDIIVEESIGVGDQVEFKIPEEPVSVRLPAGLRTRHPLLGTDMENQPRTHVKVKKEPNDSFSYDDTSEASESQVKRKKKKKKSRDSYSDQSAAESDLNYSSSTELPHKKKKKHKHSDGPDNDSFNLDLSAEVVKKKKKKKKHHDEMLC